MSEPHDESASPSSQPLPDTDETTLFAEDVQRRETAEVDTELDDFVTQHFSVVSQADTEVHSEEQVLSEDRSASELPTASMSSLKEAVFQTTDPRELGEFKLVTTLGSGGFGIVYQATDLRLDRDVAIKVIKPNRLGDDRRRENFRAEAKAVAQLRHPNIVPVHQAGQVSSGQIFIVYEFIDGPTLRNFMRVNGAFTAENAVSLMTRIADGLGYAHQQGIVHRDIKPENILIEKSTGEPHIADFGCASQQAYRQTVAGEVLSNVYIGTPQYFSPEQAAGKSHLADTRSDVWALGIVLDEMLTGRRTFREEEKTAETITDLFESIRNVRPKPLRERTEKVDADLDAIWAKCLATSPVDRYQNASDLAEDLRRWSRKEPVIARPIGTTERLVRWAQRNPAVASSVAAVFAAMICVSLVSYSWFRQQKYHNLDMARNVVDRVTTVDPDEVPRLVEQLSSKSFRQSTRVVVISEWEKTVQRLKSGPVDADVEKKASRLALSLAVLDSVGDDPIPQPLLQASRDCLAERLVSNSSPSELVATISAVQAHSDENEWLVERLNAAADKRVQSNSRLRALCALHLLGKQQVDDRVGQLLFETASVDQADGNSWIPLAYRCFPDLDNQLVALRTAADENASDREVIDRLLIAVADEPADLVRQIFDSNRSLVAILPTLKARLQKTPIDGGFEGLVKCAGGVELSSESIAKLWITYLYVSDVAAEFAEIDEHLLRLLDPTDRTAETIFVCEAHSSGISPESLLELAELWHRSKDARLAPILLALGNYQTPANFSGVRRQLLTSIWTGTPNAATHSACDWLLRRWQIEVGSDRLPTEYRNSQHHLVRNWRFNRGQTFVRMTPPEEPFLVGTSESELARFDTDLRNPKFEGYEVANRQRLIGPFEISTTEVTVAQFEQFLADRNDAIHLVAARNGIHDNRTKSKLPESEHAAMPADGLHWYNAVEYCIWLSEQHALESCYGTMADVANGFKKVKGIACDRTKSGYRLPTNGEWEWACRAGTNTLWPFARNEQYISEFAACLSSGGEMLIVGSLRPNALGLFDMLGNAAEFTDSLSKPWTLGETVIDSPVRHRPTTTISFDIRGGGYFEPVARVRSAKRVAVAMHQDGFGRGFRLVRSIPVTKRPQSDPQLK